MTLGIYPSYQYSMDPAVNPKINPHVTFPQGVYQTTVQPLGPYYGGGPRVRLLGASGHAPIQFLGSKVQLFGLGGFRGLGTITDTVSSLGSFAILALAVVGGWSVYKKLAKRR